MTTGTVSRVNFEPVRDILPIQVADFSLVDPTLADPNNALTLIDGEWVTIDSAYKIARACDVTNAAAFATVGSFPLFAERGRTDVLAQGQRKMPVLWLGMWEFDTRIYDTAATLGTGGGAAIASIMQPVKVGTLTLGTRKYVGIIGHGVAGVDTDPIVGYVTRLPAQNGGKLRIRGGMNF